MSISFHTTRDPWSASITTLEYDDIETINAALRASGHSFFIDGCGNTKLTDWHIDVLRKLTLPSPIGETLRQLNGHEVIYVMGE